MPAAGKPGELLPPRRPRPLPGSLSPATETGSSGHSSLPELLPLHPVVRRAVGSPAGLWYGRPQPLTPCRGCPERVPCTWEQSAPVTVDRTPLQGAGPASRGAGGWPHGAGLRLLCPWALGPQPRPPAVHQGCWEVTIQARAMGRLWHPAHRTQASVQTEHGFGAPGPLSPSTNAKPVPWGLCSQRPMEGGLSRAPPPPPRGTGTARLPCREGAPLGTGGGLCHCLLTGTVSALVYKRRGEPRGWLGLGAGPDPSGSKPGLPGAVPGLGSPAAHAAHPAHGRSACGEDFISAQRQQRRPTVSPGDRRPQASLAVASVSVFTWAGPPPRRAMVLPPPSPRCPGDSRVGEVPR